MKESCEESSIDNVKNICWEYVLEKDNQYVALEVFNVLLMQMKQRNKR